MMKKIKTFLLAIVCAICLCFALTGCSTVGSLVNGSLNYSAEGNIYSGYNLTYSFKILIDNECDCEVEYTITIKDANGNETYSFQDTESLKDCKPGEVTIESSRHISAEYYGETHDVYISDVKVSGTKIDTSANVPANNDTSKIDPTIGYAIGFGLLGALLLGGLITLFVLDKQGKLPKTKKED